MSLRKDPNYESATAPVSHNGRSPLTTENREEIVSHELRAAHQLKKGN